MRFWLDLYNKRISIFSIKHMSTIFRTLQVNKWQSKKQTFFSFCKINANKFGTKNEISHEIIYHYMTSYGYIIMIIVDSCIIWFHFVCIMQLKKSYYIASNVSSRKKVLLLLVISLTVDFAATTSQTANNVPLQITYIIYEQLRWVLHLYMKTF